MERLLRESLEAGAFGFTSSWAISHNDANGDPVPSRHATAEELVHLSGVVRDYEGTNLEFIPTVGRFEESHYQLMTDMSVAANRPLNWNLIAVNLSPRQMEGMESRLGASDFARQRGGRVLALTVPCAVQSRLSLESGFVFDMLNGWAKPMALPVDEKMAMLADPAQRREMNELAQGPEPDARHRQVAPAHDRRGLRRRPTATTRVARSARSPTTEGRETFDVLCDIALADDLRTGLYQPVVGDDEATWQKRVEVWRDERTLVGGTDAGAHLDLLATFNATTAMLGTACREMKLLPFEEAISYITDAPAQLYGLKDRGRLAAGYHADVVVLDPTTVAAKPIEIRHDLPGGSWRLYGEADGIDHVLVNGTEIVDHGRLTGARPGRVMRSGQDTGGTAIS